ncbi:MAG TPA: peptidyl-prolyl cis-trans isomerase, partial [Nitrospira sp.]|nr:peptidyl-prolyl cis-trans isomerase [Nitrospira sp.]
MIISTRISTRILFWVLALACLGTVRPVSAAKVEDRIVAIVNSDLITWSELKREVTPERERLEKQYRGEELARRLKMAEAMALTTMIERRLQLQEAKARSIDVGDQEVKQAIKQLIQQGEKIDDKDPANTKSVRDQLTLLRVVDREVRSGVMVADPEMKRYYQEHRDRFALPEEYTLSQILIKPRSLDDLAEARSKTRDIMALLKQGESYEDLALRYSDGPNASRGGRLGLVRQGELLPAIERGVSKLSEGGISDVIESPEGFHIVRLEDKKPKQFRPYEEVKQEIQALVFQQKSEDMFQAWLADLKDKAYIEI